MLPAITENLHQRVVLVHSPQCKRRAPAAAIKQLSDRRPLRLHKLPLAWWLSSSPPDADVCRYCLHSVMDGYQRAVQRTERWLARHRTGLCCSRSRDLEAGSARSLSRSRSRRLIIASADRSTAQERRLVYAKNSQAPKQRGREREWLLKNGSIVSVRSVA